MIGLSPRVRGNLGTPNVASTLTRSIPACAGEPRLRRLPALPSAVYPRVCGGTSYSGLSPRVRGNLCRNSTTCVPRRSIPACAGEPRGLSPRVRGNQLRSCAFSRARRVYPRVCGGTSSSSMRSPRSLGLSPRVRGNPTRVGATQSTGLSPRVRGNRARLIRPQRAVRSIPACAGEPVVVVVLVVVFAVYPRVCGGTIDTA